MKGTSSNSSPACTAVNTLPGRKGGSAVILTGEQPNQKASKSVKASYGSVFWHQAPPTLLSVQCPCGKQGLWETGFRGACREKPAQLRPKKGKGKSKSLLRHFPSHSKLVCWPLRHSMHPKICYSLLFTSLPGG